MTRSNFGRAVALLAAYAVALQALLVAFALPRDALLTVLCSDARASATLPVGRDIAWPCTSPCTMPGCASATATPPEPGIALTCVVTELMTVIARPPILTVAAIFGPQIPRAPPVA